MSKLRAFYPWAVQDLPEDDDGKSVSGTTLRETLHCFGNVETQGDLNAGVAANPSIGKKTPLGKMGVGGGMSAGGSAGGDINTVKEGIGPYGESLWQKGGDEDRLATKSPADPNYWENPEAGSFYETGPIHCDTCNVDTNASDLMAPRHISHDTRYTGEKHNFDISNMGDFVRLGDGTGKGIVGPTSLPDGGQGAGGSCGADSYRLDWIVKGNDLSWAPKPLEEQSDAVMRYITSDPEAGPNTLADAIIDGTKPY